MCERLLSCPLCSQASFPNLDSLRAGLISVATRPLICPVCNEVLRGIDKLTIHLFGHTITANNGQAKIIDAAADVGPDQPWAPRPSAELDDVQTTREIEISTVPGLLNEELPANPIPNEKLIQRPELTKNNQLVKTNDLVETNHVIFLQDLTQLHQVCVLSQPECSTTNVNLSCQGNLEQSQPTGTVQLVQAVQPAESFKAVHGRQDQNTQFSCPNDTDNSTSIEYQQSNTVDQNNPTEYQETWMEALSTCARSQESVVCQEGDTRNNDQQASTEPVKLTDETSGNHANEERALQVTESQSNENSQDATKKTNVLPQLKAFCLIATKEKTERCNICGFHFPDRNILQLHKQLVHMIDEKDLNSSLDDLKNYPCHLCSKVFKMRGSLMVHMRVAHTGYNLGSLRKEGETIPTLGDNGYNCPTCGKNFKKEQHVTQHLKTHEGKQWECDVCSKMFTTKYFLKKHKRLHSGEMPYKCNLCDKTFTFQQSYHKHRLYHKDDKPHSCNTCGRSFKELSTLHNHERIHTGEKPFACETCGKCFRQRVSYLVHRRIHTGVMPYKCTACGKSFRYKVSQRTHKCPAQPPGTVVHQTGNLVNRLLQISQPESSEISPKATEDHQTANFVPTEENKFVLILNDQGQHILTRQSDLEHNGKDKKQIASDECEDESLRFSEPGEFIKNLWGHEISSATTLKESIEISSKDSPRGSKSDTDDFLNMVGLADNDAASPSTEMEHLRLSSPGSHQDNLIETCEIGTFGQTEQTNVRDDYSDVISTNISCTLHTINEESLKQLLYGTDTRQ
ncbi:zinc finger and SCAN domain-containing protein 12 [Cephus cinctus]|uniref:Zinc finger and SCAN domain-containing protein 12 n=1 Tax=Cephus cinctus TaxID=211228 RepID=A0AAJ7FU38_CEPCN|nr:zinc finger and SCAN domain-containing protein 12 [Cephus cinctus]